MNSTKHTKEPSRLLWPAYAFGDAQFFSSLTKFMATQLPNDGKARTAFAKYGIPEEIENHLPHILLGQSSRQAPGTKVIPISTLTKETIFLAERAIKTEVQIQLEQIISPIASKRPAGDFIPAAVPLHQLAHHRALQTGSMASDIGRPPPQHLDAVQEARSVRFRVCEPDHQDEKVRALSGGGGWQGGADQRGRVDGV